MAVELYHVVTGQRMELGQVIQMDETYPTGVYQRVMDKQPLVRDMLAHPETYAGQELALHFEQDLTPAQVRELVKREFDTFQMDQGGSWFYVEADNGFPYENLEALVETIRELRGE